MPRPVTARICLMVIALCVLIFILGPRIDLLKEAIQSQIAGIKQFETGRQTEMDDIVFEIDEGFPPDQMIEEDFAHDCD